MNKIIKDTLILFAITLIAGIMLGLVYDVTKTPIDNQKEKTRQEAFKAVLKDADSFESIKDKDYTKGISNLEGGDAFSSDKITEVVAGIKNNKIIGYVVTVVAADGYAGDIKFSVGISADGTYKGTSILSISETAGLGMRVKTNPEFLSQFDDKSVESFKLVKDGSGKDNDDTIDAISGSTVTSKAVTNGINAALVVYKDLSASKVQTVGGATVE